MTFSYTLLGALLLLLPGFAGYFGFRIGEARDLVSPRPDRPNSTLTVFLVVALALAAHCVGAALFVANDWVARGHALVQLSYDPNPYRALLRGHAPANLSSLAIEFELLFFVALTLGTGAICARVARVPAITRRTDPLRFGWLLPIVQQVEAGRHVAVGYVRTTSSESGAWIAYEGIVRRLTVDDDGAIRMIVLEQCDRFLVRIADDTVRRVTVAGRPIALMHLREEAIADVALELFEVPEELGPA